jgi:hypothetical protein
MLTAQLGIKIKAICINDLFDAMNEAWRDWKFAYVDNLIKSMAKRCATVIKLKGYYRIY